MSVKVKKGNTAGGWVKVFRNANEMKLTHRPGKHLKSKIQGYSKNTLD